MIYLSVPAIRDRKEDILPLVEHFLGIYCARNCKFVNDVERDVIEMLMNYPWPGNVRELENCIEKMVVMAPGNSLTSELLPIAIMAYNKDNQAGLATPVAAPCSEVEPVAPADPESMLASLIRSEVQTALDSERDNIYNMVREKWERHLFELILDRYRNNKTKAARALGISRNTLNSRLSELSHITREWKV